MFILSSVEESQIVQIFFTLLINSEYIYAIEQFKEVAM